MGAIILTPQASINNPSNGSIALYPDSNLCPRILGSSGINVPLLKNRNRIINGHGIINQRNPTALGASAVDGGYTIDRFLTNFGGSYGGTLTWTWDTTDFPTFAQAGRTFTRSLKLLTTQDTTPGTDGQCYLSHKIEGYNIADILGSGYNAGFTLSFWVKNSVTGTYCVALRNAAQDRSYIAEYTINTANTWEFKTIYVTSAPSGTWQSTNLTGLHISWSLVMGTDFDDGVNGSWVSSNEFATANQTNWASVAANFWITGVQLEAGPVATPFEFRDIAEELRLCQRYCYVPGYLATGASATGAQIPVVAAGLIYSATSARYILINPGGQFRALPALTVTASQWLALDGVTDSAISAITIDLFSGPTLRLLCTITGAAAGRGSLLVADATGGRIMIFDAEL